MKVSSRNRKLTTFIFIIVPIVLCLSLALFLKDNYDYNHTRRVGNLTSECFDGEFYNFGEVSVQIFERGGDSGAWPKDPIYDDEGNELHGASVGTIYEALIVNKSDEVINDWSLKIPINEMMWINNSWNSKIEIHQDVKGNEKVTSVDLADYSLYDIELDYYIDHTGPMIPLYEGDYFIYYPEQVAEEKPINPSLTGEIGESCARFGYIMYVPDKDLDYVADFSGGEIIYYMYANPVKSTFFWTVLVLLLIWLIALIITIIVDFKVKKLIERQKAEKAHDAMMIEQTMKLIINMIENKDTSTKGHSLRVAEYSRMMAKKLGYNDEELQQIYYIGLLHDCGKVNIPDRILKYPGKLSDEDFAIMKKHTTYGAEILKDFTSIKGIDVGAKYHHERYDGAGYPSGIKGNDIPEIARIIGVADAFDAMNSERCYRDRLDKEIILSELEKNKGKQFDPIIVDCMLEVIKEYNIEMK